MMPIEQQQKAALTPMQVIELMKAVQADSTLSEEQKKQLVERLQDGTINGKLASGVVGGGIGLLIGKYLKLSTTAKVLLSVAGFGVGHALWNSIHDNNEKQFQDYNKKLKVYEIR